MTALTVTARDAGTGHVLDVAGELDFESAPRLREAVGRADLTPGRLLVLDLSGVTFCDSSGITTLVAARNRALSLDAGIALAAVPDHIARIFRVVGLTQVFPTFGSAEEALGSNPAAQPRCPG
jgi:anti-anti-sigma factor